MQKILITLGLLLTLAMAGCAYKIEIQQGNVVTQAQLEQLRPGLDRRQVRALLGAPLLTDPFHPDRWDYLYNKSQGGEVLESYRLTLYFSGEQLERFENDGPFPAEEYQRPRGD